MGYLRYICWGLLGAGFAAGTAAAQSQRRLEIFTSARALYDSNFARSSKAQAQARGIKQQELRFSPALEVRAGIPFGLHTLTLNALAGYDFHAVNSRFNRERLEAVLGLASRLGRCRTNLEGIIARRQTELEDVLQGPVENAETVKTVSVNARCPREVGVVPDLTLRSRSIDNSQRLRRSADSDTRSAELGLTYVRPSLGELGFFARFAETEFPNRLVAAPGGGFTNDGFDVSSLGIRAARNIGLLLRGSLSLAHSKVSREGAGRDFSGITYSANLLVRPQARLNGRLLGEKRVEPSNRIGVSYSVDEIYRAEANYALSPRAAVSAGASIRDREFEVADLTGGPFLTQEKTTLGFASFRLDVHPRVALVLDAQREKRDTNVPLFDYTSTRIGLSTRIALY